MSEPCFYLLLRLECIHQTCVKSLILHTTVLGNWDLGGNSEVILVEVSLLICYTDNFGPLLIHPFFSHVLCSLGDRRETLGRYWCPAPSLQLSELSQIQIAQSVIMP